MTTCGRGPIIASFLQNIVMMDSGNKESELWKEYESLMKKKKEIKDKKELRFLDYKIVETLDKTLERSKGVKKKN